MIVEEAGQPSVDQRLLSDMLAGLEGALPAREAVIDALAGLVRTRDDAAIVRINPVRFADEGWSDSEPVGVDPG